MAIRPMRYLPDQILRTKAVSVKARDVSDPTIQQLIDEMVESMRHYNGVGIAANQVGSRYRVCIINRPDEDALPWVLVNPRITRREGQREVSEGCLSLPGYQGDILRSERVWATALDREGNRVTLKGATDLLAQVLEHETDHLDGVAYIDHLRKPEDLYELKRDEGDKEPGSEASAGSGS